MTEQHPTSPELPAAAPELGRATRAMLQAQGQLRGSDLLRVALAELVHRGVYAIRVVPVARRRRLTRRSVPVLLRRCHLEPTGETTLHSVDRLLRRGGVPGPSSQDGAALGDVLKTLARRKDPVLATLVDDVRAGLIGRGLLQPDTGANGAPTRRVRLTPAGHAAVTATAPAQLAPDDLGWTAARRLDAHAREQARSRVLATGDGGAYAALDARPGDWITGVDLTDLPGAGAVSDAVGGLGNAFGDAVGSAWHGAGGVLGALHLGGGGGGGGWHLGGGGGGGGGGGWPGGGGGGGGGLGW